MEYETLTVTLENHIATVRLNRPEKANAMNATMWQEIRKAFQWVDAKPEARVAVLQGEGKLFCAGIDLQMMMAIGPQVQNECDGRTREALRRVILDMQDTLTSLERCRKPVLAAIHGGCVGGGIDLITCADMRYCSADAYFTIKEIDIGMTADVGTLQRLPKLVGEGITRELASADGKSVVLEFSAKVNGKELKGIDLIAFNDEGKIVDFEVMVRPMSALQALGDEMAKRLAPYLAAMKGAKG